MRRVYNKGFSLIEITVVLVIITILLSIAVPYFVGNTERAKKVVCNANCLQFEKMYETFLIIEGVEHSDALLLQYFDEYGKNICQDHGDITYIDGKVQCSKHVRDDGTGSDEDDESVPFL